MTVGGDDQHAVVLYDWRTSNIVFNAKGHGADIYNIAFNPYGAEETIALIGIKCFKTWTGSAHKKASGIFGKLGPTVQ